MAIASNGSITNDIAATNRVTIQNGVRYAVGHEGIKGKLQIIQPYTVRARVQLTVHEEFATVQSKTA
jgi:hypothetical protein